MRWSIAIVLCLVPVLGSAQESRLRADFRRESERVRDACSGFSFKKVRLSCLPIIRRTSRRVACHRRTDSVWAARSLPPRTPKIGG